MCEVYNSKGIMAFSIDFENDKITVKQRVKTKDEMLQGYSDETKKRMFESTIYNLFNGKTFLEMITTNQINNRDGSIANIFVDGYDSNLGLFVDGFSDGNFLVGKTMFEHICNEHEVLVNWANI